MSDFPCAVRVLAKDVGRHQDKVVRLVGKVISAKGDIAKVQTPDGKIFTMKINPHSEFSEYVEFEAQVENDSTLQERGSFNLGSDF
eukprot:Awhi_evm1s5300